MVITSTQFSYFQVVLVVKPKEMFFMVNLREKKVRKQIETDYE